MTGEPREDFADYVRLRSPALMRTAFLITGNVTSAEDLVQSALAKLFPRWRRVASGGSPDAYVRTVMLHEHRRAWRRLQRSAPPYSGIVRDEVARYDEYDRLRRALLMLPERQRAVVVLRYFDDLREYDVAEIMGISVGTVKSQASRGLAALRAALWDPTDVEAAAQPDPSREPRRSR